MVKLKKKAFPTVEHPFSRRVGRGGSQVEQRPEPDLPLRAQRAMPSSQTSSVTSSGVHGTSPLQVTPSTPILWLLAACLATAVTLPGVAQKPLIVRQPPAVAEYILGSGDQITIHVVDMEEIPSAPMRIDPNGFIDLPLIGRVEAGGKTIEQLHDELRSKLSRYISSPQISINLVENQSRSASVVGSVNSPGVHALEGPRRLLEVISLAGGVRPDAGSRIVLTRQARWGELPLVGARMDATGGYSTATISLEALMSATSPADNILIDPGDVIAVPKAEIVYILGNVKKAGGFPLTSKDSMSVLQTLSLAEGLSPNAAARNAQILRPAPGGDGKVREIPVDITAIERGQSPDVPLYANDVLFVPNSLAKAGAKRSAEAILQVATGVLIYGR